VPHPESFSCPLAPPPTPPTTRGAPFTGPAEGATVSAGPSAAGKPAAACMRARRWGAMKSERMPVCMNACKVHVCTICALASVNGSTPHLYMQFITQGLPMTPVQWNASCRQHVLCCKHVKCAVVPGCISQVWCTSCYMNHTQRIKTCSLWRMHHTQRTIIYIQPMTRASYAKNQNLLPISRPSLAKNHNL